MMHVMLVGNPNCGKTTLFNALTGENQRVGNWPGVTVEQKTGSFDIQQHRIELIDLPGVYSLSVSHQGSSTDEKITAVAVTDQSVDVIVNVIDACQLERHLYLTSQLFELGKPIVLALNMTDIAIQRGIVIDSQALSERLGCEVVAIQAHRHQGLDSLKQAILKGSTQTSASLHLPLPEALHETLIQIEDQWIQSGRYIAQQASYWARRLLEGDTLGVFDGHPLIPSESDIWMADARYQVVHDLASVVQTKRSDASEYLTAKIDRVVLHRFWALPIFFGVMYVMFFFAINLGGAFQDFFDLSSDALFVQGFASMLQALDAPNWLTVLLANGLGKGINTTLTFIPVIASMFFFLALLETSGYMARAAFVVDKIMRVLGLPGKSFVPMIVGFGCNVPAIMAARTLDSERERLLTVLMSPFMSCSARLAIYAIFVATFFPVGGHNVVFSLYLIGILMAVFTGFLLRKTLFQGTVSPLLLELPVYHRPSLRRLLRETRIRLYYFIVRAGRLILPVCVVLGGLNSLTWQGSGDSVLSIVGQWMTPIFSPMGLHQDNWPATMGLLTGMLAKEVVVGTLHSLYSQVGHLTHQATAVSFDLGASMWAAIQSIPQNFAHLGQVIIHPITAATSRLVIPSAVGEIMVQHFDGQSGAYAYLLFVLLYVPCVSTMAAIRQEAGRGLMWFSIAWSLLLAYSVSVVFYQLATWHRHPAVSCVWVFVIGVAVWMVMALMRRFLSQTRGAYVSAAS